MSDENMKLLEPVYPARYTHVEYKDEQGPGGAYHDYYLGRKGSQDTDRAGEFGHIRFQNGAIQEAGEVNGCFNEDLIDIVIHRLQCFQGSEFACRENAIAITKLEEARQWLNHRTVSRQNRGVEGTHQV